MGVSHVQRVDSPRDFGKSSCLSNLFLQFPGPFEKCGSFLSRSEQTLAASGRRRAHATREIHAERAQLEMQLIVARVATAAAVACEASARTSFETARYSAED
jgi:hypothetical protein